MSFDALKKNRSAAFDKLNKQLEKVASKTSYSDPDDATYWKPTRDAAGNAFAIIRFLPATEGDDPFKILYNYGFQGPSGAWYIENSLTTLGQDDPCDQYYWKLYNSNKDKDSPVRKQASEMRRRQNYITNILVIKDGGNSDNNGKVFRYKFGPKIWAKLNDLMNPTFEDEKPVNPFDFWEGANFRIKVTGKGRDTSYDKSEFDSPSELFDGDEDKLRAVYDAMYSLSEVVAPKKFKDYATLEAKLYRVLGLTGAQAQSGNATAEDDLPEEGMDMSKLGEEAAPAATPKETKARSEKAQPKATSVADAAADEGEEDDDLAFFQNLTKK